MPVPREQFNAQDVIAYLRRRRDEGVPAWKRMRIIEGLMDFRQFVQQQSPDDLRPLQIKMKEIIVIEKQRDQGQERIDDVAGRIDPSEPDAIQAFRRAVRTEGLEVQHRKGLREEAEGVHGGATPEVFSGLRIGDGS